MIEMETNGNNKERIFRQFAEHPDKYTEVNYQHAAESLGITMEELKAGIERAKAAIPIVMKASELVRPDMPASVLCGRLGEICRARLSDFPIAYAWPSILAAASVLVKPHPKDRCNIFACTVGSADSGKSQSQKRANYLLGLEQEQALVNDSKYGSAEGLLEDIGDRNGTTVLWSPDELSHLLEKAQIQGASFPYVLNTLFYNDRNNVTVMHRKRVKFCARVTIAGGVVEENFGDSFGSATTAGLYSRFLFGLCPSGFRYLYSPLEGPPEVEAVDESQPKAGLFDNDLNMPQLPRYETPPIHPGVWQSRNEIIHQEGIEPRLLELCIRTALICGAWDKKKELRTSDLEPAWELARYQHRVRAILQPNPGRNFEAVAAHKILGYVNQYADGDQWLKWRDVSRATHVLDLGPSIADRARKGLVFSGELEESKLGKSVLVRKAQGEK